MSSYKNLVSASSKHNPQNVPSAQSKISGKESIMSDNNNGGVSFDLAQAAQVALQTGNVPEYRRCSQILVRRCLVMGTDKNQFAVSAQKLTDDALTLFKGLIKNGHVDVIVDDIREVYGKSLAPKLTFSLLALAFLTSVPDSVTGSAKDTAAVRTSAYGLVKMLRTAAHLIMWENFHLTFCKTSGVKGTGTGFRNAVGGWLINNKAQGLAYQVTKYMAREGVSMQDLVRLTHPKTTTATKCRCKKAKSTDPCKCDASKPVTNIVDPDIQVVLAFVAHDLSHAATILKELVARSCENGDMYTDTKLHDAMTIFSYLCAVTKAKNENTSNDELCSLIGLYNLPREVVNTKALNSVDVWMHLLLQMPTTGRNGFAKRLVDQAVTDVETKKLLSVAFPDDGLFATVLPKDVKVNMPITALLRNLAKMSALNMFEDSVHPLGPQMLKALCDRVVDVKVLEKGHVHPLTVLSAWATYKTGHGLKGSLSWTPNKKIIDALQAAFYAAFRTLKGQGWKIGHGIDASGSMTSATTPVSGLMSSELVAIMAMAFYRSEHEFSNTHGTPFRQDIGYFANSFKEYTSEVSEKSTFEEMCQIVQRSDWGSTNIGSFVQWAINKLTASLEKFKSKQNNMHQLPVFAWPGFYNALMVWTDNDVNSGSQPMSLFQQYQTLVKRCFQAQPLAENGQKTNPDTLFRENVPKLVVVATVPTPFTVGDPTDSNVLNVSGFDLSVPTLLNAFLSGGKVQVMADDDDSDE